MKLQIAAIITAMLSVGAVAEETVLQELSFKELNIKSGTIISEPGQADVLKIENNLDQPLVANLFTIEKPNITTDVYSVVGEARYDDVNGDGFLEMWNHFGHTEAYFSRTLGASGPMGKLTGSSDWRDFHLPFHAKGAKSPVQKLVINLHLPGKGTVYLRNLKLVQNARSGAAAPLIGGWWSDQQIGMIAGLGGAFIGCLAGVIEWLASRGKAQTFVVNAVRVLIAAGFAMVALGLVALGLRQPHTLWFALLLFGAFCALIFPFRLRRYSQRYRELELRRISSMDVAMT